jgi:V/A-type H+-transporting ATPase subunit I
MTSSDLGPVRMTRVAVVAPLARRRAAFVELADSGLLEVEQGPRPTGEVAAVEIARGAPPGVEPVLAVEPVDVEVLRERGDWGRLAGEAELARRATDVLEHGPAAVLLGWVPEASVDTLARRLAPTGTSVVPLPRPSEETPPTRLPESRLARPLRPLVSTYSVVPYEDVDPSLFAGITYVLMFGMMFGDVGHGLVLAALGLLLLVSKNRRFQRVRHLWFFPVAAGLAAAVMGLLYGEAFGPTGLVPTLWFSPLDDPIRLLLVAVGVGAALVGVSYVIGTVNRWREGGPRTALYAPNGLAGVVLFAGAALLAGGLASGTEGLSVAGGMLAALGLVLTFVGFLAEAGGGGAAVGQASVELFDTVIRIVVSVVSFGRLAAFGLTHAAIGAVVWDGTTALWQPGVGALLAILLFVVGNALAFALEALVAGVQALRLEYYELFSRIFAGEGRVFHPWHIRMVTEVTQ